MWRRSQRRSTEVSFALALSAGSGTALCVGLASSEVRTGCTANYAEYSPDEFVDYIIFTFAPYYATKCRTNRE
jgi:hypothetical protein